MTRILHPQYRDENASGIYPFADGSTLRSNTGNYLDRGLFIDAVIHPIGVSSPQKLSRIDLAGLTVTFTVGDNLKQSCRGIADLSQPSGVIALTDADQRPAGMFLVNPVLLSQLQNWSIGTHVFNNTAQFVATVCIPSPEIGVRGLSGDTAGVISGDVWLVGENGVNVSEEDGCIRIDIVGDPLFARKLCDTTGAFGNPDGGNSLITHYLKTINGIPPDAQGNFFLGVSQILSQHPALRIYASEKGLTIELAAP